MANGYKLGMWVVNQRSTKFKLSQLKRYRLEALKGWTWDTRQEAWETGFRYLSEFCATHGHCLVKSSFKQADGFNLGGWVVEQRSNRLELPTERRLRLESLTGWAWDSRQEAWEKGFSYLPQYCDTHGDCFVTKDYKHDDGYPTGSWVSVQRIARSSLPADRKQRLEGLKGWTWDARQKAWDIGFQNLSEYCAINGHCLVPGTYKSSNGYRLGSWVSVQRLGRAKMAPERMAALEALPGWAWSARQTRERYE
jgi:hypothetical protein